MRSASFVCFRQDAKRYIYRWVIPAAIRPLLGGKREVKISRHAASTRGGSARSSLGCDARKDDFGNYGYSHQQSAATAAYPRRRSSSVSWTALSPSRDWTVTRRT